MGRIRPNEKYVEGITYIPYSNWVDWMKSLSQVKYGVHLMRTHAAGTFALNCAYLGIPCIGYEGLDTQQICFPDLTVKVGDLKTAKYLATELRRDEEFYQECSQIAKSGYEYFSESSFLKHMDAVFSSVFDG